MVCGHPARDLLRDDVGFTHGWRCVNAAWRQLNSQKKEKKS
jgi:hypothetical protein